MEEDMEIRETRVQVQGLGVNCYCMDGAEAGAGSGNGRDTGVTVGTAAGAGAGKPAILLLHGAGVDSALLSWERVIPLFAGAGHRVVAPDLPGYGKSDRYGGDYSLPFYTGVAAGVMDALGMGSSALVGLSMGGGIAIHLALQEPSRALALVPVDSWGLAKKLPYHSFMYWYARTRSNERLYERTAKHRGLVAHTLTSGLFGDKSLVTDELVADVQARMMEPGAGWPFVSFQRNEIAKDGLVTDLHSRLGEIRAPTLLVHGSLDKAVPAKNSVAARALIPGSELCMMEGCRHWPNRERPQEFADAVLGFLARRLAPGAPGMG
jgi:pimeloyl-ACP methyl ester carboxylesterase